MDSMTPVVPNPSLFVGRSVLWMSAVNREAKIRAEKETAHSVCQEINTAFKNLE